MTSTVLRPVTDGVVTVRAPEPSDAAVIVAGRDDEFHRWLGPGEDDPRPSACIEVAGHVVGWVDFDVEREWLEPGEVNVGYALSGHARGRGYASRAVQLLMHHLAQRGEHHIATVLVDPANFRSLALAERLGFESRGAVGASRLLVRPVPPLTYSDGVVTIRRQEPEDLDADLEAKDDEQIDWLWLPGQRELWEAMTPSEQRAHALAGMEANRDAFGTGPKWIFAVDAPCDRYVAYVDCDLANDGHPNGEANISYSAHPDHRGRGYVSRSVRLVARFLRDHTAAPRAHVGVRSSNLNSLRVARSVGAVEVGRRMTAQGEMIDHVIELR